MKPLLIGAAVAAFVACCSPGVAFANEADRCSNETLRGRYVFSASGFVLNAGVVQPKAIVEVLEFDGNGSVAVLAATRSVAGVIVRSNPSVWTYTVTEGCVGTIQFDGPAFDVFVSPRGNQFWLIQTNPNNVFEGSATRVLIEPESDRP